MSSSKVFDRDVKGFKKRFAVYWSQWLKQNYKSPYAVHKDFGCELQTACYWWNADHKPGGEYVSMAGVPFAQFIEDKP